MKHVFWFRRDLRLKDNAALYHALKAGRPVMPVFIFDREILDDLPRRDARLLFIHRQLSRLKDQLEAMGSSLWVYEGRPLEVWRQLIQQEEVEAVFANHDYEPYARSRDAAVEALLKESGIAFHTFKDQVMFEKREILTQQGKPYTVFTPYSRQWKARLKESGIPAYDTEPYLQHFVKGEAPPLPTPEALGFEEVEVHAPAARVDEEVLRVYDQKRNFPALNATSRLSVHLRFGTLSIRQLVQQATRLNETYLNELIWREFYMQILWNFPHVVHGPFKKEYAAIAWEDDEAAFRRWCEGKTGFPIVDAGMRQLNATGYMHNRVRMITASFLVKDLLINWQWGEAYFAEKLLDYELSSNNGGWQWAAGCGTDAAPYFRIFNPQSQQKKFDPDCAYIRKWVPEYGTPAYPAPMVDHRQARQQCLQLYRQALNRR